MTTPEFIDLVLTPIAGGIGAAVAFYFGARRQVAAKTFPRFGFLLVGVAVGLALAAINFLGRS
jgi:ABC-type enterobactin transport system permease subunit